VKEHSQGGMTTLLTRRNWT